MDMGRYITKSRASQFYIKNAGKKAWCTPTRLTFDPILASTNMLCISELIRGYLSIRIFGPAKRLTTFPKTFLMAEMYGEIG